MIRTNPLDIVAPELFMSVVFRWKDGALRFHPEAR
uniref:Uncharacterized protein n=1 Tax=Chlorobium phaeobacteroides (strain BS1) TaxID=331678 RepID=B3EKL5_CHLPB